MKTKNVLKTALVAGLVAGCSVDISKTSDEILFNTFSLEERQELAEDIKIANWYENIGTKTEYKDSLVNLIYNELPKKTKNSFFLANEIDDPLIIYKIDDELRIDLKDNEYNYFNLSGLIYELDLTNDELERIRKINESNYNYSKSESNIWQIPVNMILEVLGYDLAEGRNHIFDMANKSGIFSDTSLDEYLVSKKVTKEDLMKLYDKSATIGLDNEFNSNLNALLFTIDKTLFFETKGDYFLKKPDYFSIVHSYKIGTDENNNVQIPLIYLGRGTSHISDDNWIKWKTLKETLRLMNFDVDPKETYEKYYDKFFHRVGFFGVMSMDKTKKEYPEADYAVYGGGLRSSIPLDDACSWEVELGFDIFGNAKFKTQDTTSSFIDLVFLDDYYEFHKLTDFSVEHNIFGGTFFANITKFFGPNFGLKVGVSYSSETETVKIKRSLEQWNVNQDGYRLGYSYSSGEIEDEKTSTRFGGSLGLIYRVDDVAFDLEARKYEDRLFIGAGMSFYLTKTEY